MTLQIKETSEPDREINRHGKRKKKQREMDCLALLLTPPSPIPLYPHKLLSICPQLEKERKFVKYPQNLYILSVVSECLYLDG